MRDNVKVSAIQFAPSWLDCARNAIRMAEWVEHEACLGADLVVFPELSNLGPVTPVRIGENPGFDQNTSAYDFQVKYKKTAESIPGPTTNMLAKLAHKLNVHIAVGLAQTHPDVTGTLYNSAVLIGPSGLINVQNKIHIQDTERWYFYPGHRPVIFETNLGKIGISFAYDAVFFPEIIRSLSLGGAEILCVLGNLGEKVQDRKEDRPAPNVARVSRIRGRENATFVVWCNRTGTTGNTRFIGRSSIVGPDGRIMHVGDSDQEKPATANLTHDELLLARSRIGVFRDRRPEIYGKIIEPLSTPYSGSLIETARE